MSVNLDVENRRLAVGVRDLLGDGSRRTIGLGGGGLSRLRIGQALHEQIQAELVAADPDYMAETPVELEIEVDGWEVRVAGRADGVAFREGRPERVDEIKTLHFAVELYNLYAEDRLERFREQLRLYALMVSLSGQEPAARLILVDIVTGERRTEDVPWSPRSVRAWLEQQVRRLLAAESRRLERVRARKDAADEIPFPHPELRPGQGEISETVASSLEAGRHLLVHAPTGCGKTAAVLHPALLFAFSTGRRLFYLTAKTLQQQIAIATSRAMQGDLYTSLQLRAKAKMCANTEMICHEEICDFAAQYGLKLVRSGLVPQLLDAHPHLDPDDLFETGRNHELCPFELSLDLLPDADLVVCDYNYVFDPTIGLDALLHGGALRDAVLIIDEAHNLVERSRDYYSPGLGTDLLERAAAYLEARSETPSRLQIANEAQSAVPEVLEVEELRLRPSGAASRTSSRFSLREGVPAGPLDSRTVTVFERLAELCRELSAFIRRHVDAALPDGARGDGLTELDRDEVGRLRVELDAAMLQYFLFKREQELWIANDPALEVFLALTRLHRVLTLAEGEEEFIHLASRSPAGVEQVRILCRDASRFLGATFEECAGVVAMSATLEPFAFFQDLLGFEPPRTDTLHLPTPFPPENRLVLTIDEVDTTWRHRAAHYDLCAAWIARLAQPGRNVLVLFPSYAYLQGVGDRLPPVEHTVLTQESGAPDAAQRELLETLANGGSHLVLGVLGGVFAEGVDYPGEMLSQVMVVSPGLPQFNAERQLLKAYFQERYGHGFSYAYLIPGLTRVVQAAGRLIRSDSDRGVITLIGRRFTDPRYGRLLPEDWTGGDPGSLVLDDPVATVEDFFAQR